MSSSVVYLPANPVEIVRVRSEQPVSVLFNGPPGPAGPAPTVPRYALVDITPEVSGHVVFQMDIASTIRLTLTRNVTSIAFSGLPTVGWAQRLVVYIRQDIVGGRTVSGWPANVRWPASLVPSVTPGANRMDAFVFDSLDGGSTVYGSLAASDWLA